LHNNYFRHEQNCRANLSAIICLISCRSRKPQGKNISYHFHYFKPEKNCRAKLSVALFQAFAELQSKTQLSLAYRTAGKHYQLSLALFQA
jgi:methylphosphotriester-DNA--protein-cysteine methyltransferase